LPATDFRSVERREKNSGAIGGPYRGDGGPTQGGSTTSASLCSDQMTRDGAGVVGRVTQVTRRVARATYQSEATVKAQLVMREALFRKGAYIFLACMPKSGSTFLARAIEDVTGFPHTRLCYAHERNEQELYLPKLVDTYTKSIVTQQHIKATGPNLNLFVRFGIRPVIVTRNLFDVIVSIRDYLCNEGVYGFPSLYATDHFLTIPDEEQFDFLITFAAPWYFNFYASWYDAAHDGQIETLWLTYEELTADWVDGIERVLAFYGQQSSHDEVVAAVRRMQGDPEKSRLNKGVAGRGMELLSAAQRDRLATMAAFYPWVDFGPIGL
jgi:hypothetical protein